MADQRPTIDPATLLDDGDARRVDFSAEIDGERRDFTVLYDVLEALDGVAPDSGAVAAATRHLDRIADAAARALARDGDPARVIVSENDLA